MTLRRRKVGSRRTRAKSINVFITILVVGIFLMIFITWVGLYRVGLRPSSPLETKSLRTNNNNHVDYNDLFIEERQPIILSRQNNDVLVKTDVRGNLGPPSVLNQNVPGSDWIKDRWQAASDMHGTAIRGKHWVSFEFPFVISRLSHITLDWETALSTNYKIEGRKRRKQKSTAAAGHDETTWFELFDTKKDLDKFTSREYGQSPGVKFKAPLHIVHNVTLFSTPNGESQKEQQKLNVDEIRIWIRSSDKGWGVSLWQVDVFGWKK